MGTEQKYNKLKDLLKNLKKVVVAFSGGVDSSFLLKVSRDVLGKGNVIAFIGKFDAFPQKELEDAERTAVDMDCIYEIVETKQMEDPDFIKNDQLRCYYCKRQLMENAWDIANAHNIPNVIEGSNIDDLNDYRPGMKACIELGVRSPMVEAGLNKKEIRELSKTLLLPTHSKPSFSCLATRIPYGTNIKKEILKKIELSENFIKGLNLYGVRVRFHGNIARIEADEEEMPGVIEKREAITKALNEYGFLYITLDLKGFKKTNI